MDELYHYGVKGMKWGVRRAKNAVSKQTKSSGANPVSQKYREQAKTSLKKREELNEITQAKGKAKVAKILKKIGSNLLNPVIVDRPSNSAPKPWDEKPNPNRGGRI